MSLSSLIGSLRVALSLGTADFEEGAKRASDHAKKRSREIELSFAGAKRAVEGLFAAFTVGLLTEQIKKSLDYAGSLREVASTLGVTTTQLQQFRYVASQTGVSQEALELGLKKLTISIGQAEGGSTKVVKAFKAMGIQVADLKNQNTGDVFLKVADGLSKYSDRAARAALETAVMSRNGSALDNALKGGSARINELSEAANRLGIVLSSEQIVGAEETAHKLEAVKMVLSAQIAGVVASNASAILSLSSALATLTGSIIKFLGSNPQLALGIVGALLGSRVGGLPGAVLGGAAGAILGGKVAQASLDSSNDLTVRTQQMRAAQQAWIQSLHSPGAGRAIPGGSGAQFAADPKVAEQEFRRQIGLLNRATASARDSRLPQASGKAIPQIFGGGEKKPKKGPTDRSDDVEFQFAQEQRQLDLQILDAKRQLSHDYVEQTTLSIQSLDIERAMKDAEIDHKVERAKQDAAEGKITQSALAQVVADAGIEKAKEEKLDHLKRQAVIDAEQEQRFKDVQRLDNVNFDLQRQKLQSESSLAETAKERRDVELRLLDLTYQQERARLEAIQADKQSTDADKEEARRRIAALNGQYGRDRQGVIQQTRGPVDQYLAQLPTTAAKWTEALQGVAVNGFGALEQALMDTISGTKKVGQAFGEMAKSILADLLKIAIQKAIIAPLVNALFPSGGGLGKSLFPVVGGVDPLAALPATPGFATGGSFQIAGNMGTDRNTLSLNGLPIARVSHGENVSVGTGGGGGINVYQTIAPNFAGNAATQDDLQRMFVITKAATLQAISEKHRRNS